MKCSSAPRQRLALERGTEHEVRWCGELDDGRRALRLEPHEPHGALEAPDRLDELRDRERRDVVDEGEALGDEEQREARHRAEVVAQVAAGGVAERGDGPGAVGRSA
jgi:hypothetical protein